MRKYNWDLQTALDPSCGATTVLRAPSFGATDVFEAVFEDYFFLTSGIIAQVSLTI